MTVIFLSVVLAWAVLKWAMWRISFLAVLLYYAECGADLPDAGTIKQYQTKVLEKYLKIEKKNKIL